jgi:hypothetical protein
VALAYRAAGIDRSVFATVYNLSRQSRGAPALLHPSDNAVIDGVFSSLTRPAALAEIRAQV